MRISDWSSDVCSSDLPKAANHVPAGDDAPLPITRRFVGTDAAGEYLCLSPRYMQQLRMDGNGPPYRCFGRFVVYTIEDLDRWARSAARRVGKECVSTVKSLWSAGH